MAKAHPIHGLDCDAPAFTEASAVLQVRFDEILTFHSAALEPHGIEGVHDMRVASRRFRSALRDFSPLFEKKAVKSLKRHGKLVADALGEVRDQDVAIEALGALRDKAPNAAIAAGVNALIEARQALRSDAYSQFLKHVTAERLTEIRNELERDLNLKADGDAPIFRSFAANAIERAHKKFVDRAESIYEPFNDKALHKLRLSAKRLRYALELFDNCWAGELKPFAKYVSKLQSSLGEVHDSSEWIGYLSQIRENDGIDRQTASWLISEFLSLRTAEYLKALEMWNEWLASDLTGRLRAIITK